MSETNEEPFDFSVKYSDKVERYDPQDEMLQVLKRIEAKLDQLLTQSQS